MVVPQKILPVLKPSFSIVIPVYNADSTLEKTLESVSKQRYKNYEVICVNDGSTDNSAQILQKWKDENPDLDIHIIHQKNAGLGAARNAGVEKTKNEWSALLDADDLWLPEKLDNCTETLERKDPDVLFHDFTTFGGKHNRTRTGHSIHSLEDLLLEGNPIMPSAVIVRTELLKQYSFSTNPSIHGAEDLDLWLRLLHNQKTFHHLNKSLTLYRQSGGMSTRLEDHLGKVKAVILEYYKKGWFDKRICDEAIHRKNWEAGRFYHKRGKHKKARQYYRACKNLSFQQQLIVLLNNVGISF